MVNTVYSNIANKADISDIATGETGDIGNGIRAYKFGKSVFVSFEVFNATTAYAVNTTIATLPSGYRPIYTTSFLDTLGGSHQRIIIGTDGSISSTTAVTSGQNIRGGISYISG